MSTPKHKHEASSIGTSLKNDLHSIEDGFSSVGHKISGAVSRAGTAIKTPFVEAAHTVESGAMIALIIGGVLVWYNWDSIKSTTKSVTADVYEDVKTAAPYAAAALLL